MTTKSAIPNFSRFNTKAIQCQKSSRHPDNLEGSRTMSHPRGQNLSIKYTQQKKTIHSVQQKLNNWGLTNVTNKALN